MTAFNVVAVDIPKKQLSKCASDKGRNSYCHENLYQTTLTQGLS